MAHGNIWRFWIDTGGTFTDCLGQAPDGRSVRLKVLSSGAVRGEVARNTRDNRVFLRGLPDVPRGFFAGYEMRWCGATTAIRVTDSVAVEEGAMLTIEGRPTVPPSAVVELAAGEEAPVLAMRLATQTPLGTRLPPAELRLATTRGTNALLEGKGARVAFFVTAGFGDLLRIGDQRRPDLFALRVDKPPALHGPVIEVPERLAADGHVLRPVDLAVVRAGAQALLAGGVNVAAVALLHSHINAEHERAVAALLRELGFAHVSVSSELAPYIKIVPRAETTVVDALLAPVMERYLSGVATALQGGKFLVMTSAGGLVPRAVYRPKDSLLSGPAGGVAGAAAAAARAGLQRVLSFDMGGTSTDVARWAGDFDYRFQHAVGAARVFAPAVRVESVAAGGGSICRFDGAALVVGPESAGASPGPACYGAGGPLTLTDVNLLLGRLDPSTFAVPIAMRAAEARLEELLSAVAQRGVAMPQRREVLEGFLAIADERMADSMRRISVREGFDPAEHTLVAFGGAGGLHACAVAERLGMRKVLFPGDSGLLSAAGLREAVPEQFAEQQLLSPWAAAENELPEWFRRLESEARRRLQRADESGGEAVVRRAELELRFVGQESTLTVVAHPLREVEARFRAAHHVRYGFIPTGREIEVVIARVVVSPQARALEKETFAPWPDAVQTGGRFARRVLEPGAVIRGPALVADSFSTLWIAPDWQGVVGSAGSLLMDRIAVPEACIEGDATQRTVAIDLELFTCRFLSLVGDMGSLLQRCALSVNVKERLDFSCALLDRDGYLIANAPHIPVHLGALGLCVRTVREAITLGKGDVVVTNHPGFGGSHLPDITLVAPVHDDDGALLGYVANRAHHAEIGGVRPGSMSPDATTLIQEGVVIPPMYLVRGGHALWHAMAEWLRSGPYPSRAVEENLADLQAQLAAIRQGEASLRELARQHGRDRLHEYMERIQVRAAVALATALHRLPSGGPWFAVDALDDGTRVQVHGAWRVGHTQLAIDFSGSGGVHAGNLNATPAIVRSATLYVLRILAGQDLPLNEGLMRNIELIVPAGVLAPDFSRDATTCPAVAGGNVETSQRVVDVLLQAFGLAACSQGTMNNLVFGSERVSYYETIGGGTGAVAGFAGCDAVHSHMTNTAITDPEVLEHRLPVRLERFAIRADSGGFGAFRGGNGMERHLRFLASLSLSLLTQRRRRGPPGANGGGDGAAGAQWITRVDGSREDLSEVAQVRIHEGDLLSVLTPGGGGWGSPH